MELIAALMRRLRGARATEVLTSALRLFLSSRRCRPWRQGQGYADGAGAWTSRSTVDRVARCRRRLKTRIVCVANPGNPTGTHIPIDEIERLRAGLPGDVLLLVDEAYGEFPDPGPTAAAALAARGDTIVLRTFSKAYGLAGIRVGWGVFPADMRDAMRKVLHGFAVSAPGLAAATAAMRDQAWMRAARAATIARRDAFIADVRALGIDAPASETNFALLGFGDVATATRADAALRGDGVITRGMAGYGLADRLRVTIGSDHDMMRAMEALRAWRTSEETT